MKLTATKTPNNLNGTVTLSGYSLKNDLVFNEYHKGQPANELGKATIPAGALVEIIITKTYGESSASLVYKRGRVTYQHVLGQKEAEMLVNKYYNKLIAEKI